MLKILNSWSHGYVAAAVVDALLKRDFFSALKQNEVSFEELAAKLQANEGHLRTALQLLASLGIVGINEERVTLLASPEGVYPYQDIISLYQLPFEALLLPDHKNRLFAHLNSIVGRATAPDIEMWEGAVLLPLLMALKLMPEGSLISLLEEESNQPLSAFMLGRGWLEETGGGLSLTGLGQQLLSKVYVMGVAASYRPMFSKMGELLFGDVRNVFTRDDSGHEAHIDRHINVLASGFQHNRYFEQAASIIESLFNTETLSSQPHYLADMGCGDGTFLKQIYEFIAQKTLRGRHLNNYPLTLVGIDYNPVALEAAAKNLEGFPHLLITGDISRPYDLAPAFAEKGIDKSQVLHIRSFLDHNRIYEEAEPFAHYKHISLESIHLDAAGKLIPAPSMMTNLERHLQAWAEVSNGHGILLLESHSLPPGIIRQYLQETESLYFDAIHSFTSQYLVEAEKFVTAAAHAGLFLVAPPRTYPQTLPFSRITVGHYSRRPYRVRYAMESDLEVLMQLESACWPAGLRTPKKEIARRLKTYPEGQFVLEENGEVLGAVYSQRIKESEVLYQSGIDHLGRLHHPEGPKVQLLSLNVFPEHQSRGLGGELLEFMLQRTKLMNGVEQAYGVSRCRDFKGKTRTAYENYIQQKDEQGYCVDPILRFHQVHGARIDGVVKNFRPKDKPNLGHGVLIHYDLQERRLFEGKAPSKQEARTALSREMIAKQIEKQIRRLLKKEKTYVSTYPLMEMGLDSGDLMELGLFLKQSYRIIVPGAFFFEHNTAEAVVEALARQLELDEMPVAGAQQGLPGSSIPKAFYQSKQQQEVTPGKDVPEEDIAIIGYSFRLPGASTAEELWALLREGRSAVSPTPPSRWQWPEWVDVHTTYQGINQGGYLEGIDQFDASFFRISPREAELMDPQQRMLLELCWELLERSGYKASELKGSKTGVYVGASGSDYELLLKEQGEKDTLTGTGTSLAILANRLSYFYDFEGPSIQIDTACSSSLVAIHEALKAIRAGDCSQAVVGAVHLMCHPGRSLAYHQSRMLSVDGKCYTFDERANGYVRGEG
ncbi:MAG: GNAT family N-acetyltransferase, partial [Phaeodactylibacter sp.]|nr:GNAT family N-acetyltransferase [Phaeodactylibacter sp.]